MRIRKNKITANTEDFEDYFNKPDIEDALELMGFRYLEMNFYRRVDPAKDLVIYAEMYDDAVVVDIYDDGIKSDSRTIVEPTELIDYVEEALSKRGVENIKIIEPEDLDLGDHGVALSSSILAAKHSKKSKRKKHSGRGSNYSAPTQSQVVSPAQNKSIKREKLTTRDFLSKLIKVRSSNVWAYAFNPKDEYIGDMLMQFKSSNGGPGDVYIYYDVPSKIWRKLVAAPSKGHAFWELIRHNYTYAKLTGDKRTKLPNGI